jgi:hypothetical protein
LLSSRASPAHRIVVFGRGWLRCCWNQLLEGMWIFIPGDEEVALAAEGCRINDARTV